VSGSTRAAFTALAHCTRAARFRSRCVSAVDTCFLARTVRSRMAPGGDLLPAFPSMLASDKFKEKFPGQRHPQNLLGTMENADLVRVPSLSSQPTPSVAAHYGALATRTTHHAPLPPPAPPAPHRSSSSLA
jgi:hypothetical protein